MSKVFLDTNLLVYANDQRDPLKQARAVNRLTQIMRDGNGTVSTQVLAEYAAVAITKLHQSPDIVERQLLLLEVFEVVQVTSDIIRRAVQLHQLHGIGFWDSAIVAAAEVAGCDVLLSEDFGAGRLYGSVRAENPFV